MRKVYIVISALAFALPVFHLIGDLVYWNFKEGKDLFADAGFFLKTVRVFGVTLDVIIPVSFISMMAGIFLKKPFWVKYGLLSVPIVLMILIYTYGIHIAP